jgi:hypothetical protein
MSKSGCKGAKISQRRKKSLANFTDQYHNVPYRRTVQIGSVFGHPGSGSIIICTGTVPGSFHHQGKKVRKTFISSVL